MTAGSSPSRLAAMGSRQPSSLEETTVTMRVRLTTRATAVPTWLKMVSRARLARARVTPHSTPTWSSFQEALHQSPHRSSPRERLRMTVTEDWLPQLPPVSMSMGMKAVRATWAARASSK